MLNERRRSVGKRVRSFGHDASGVRIEELLIERRKEHVNGLWVELLEGLKLLRVESAQSRQRRDPANQLRKQRRVQWNKSHA